MTRRTVLRDTLSSRAISLIERPSTKCSRRILPTVSTHSTPFTPANARETTGGQISTRKFTPRGSVLQADSQADLFGYRRYRAARARAPLLEEQSTRSGRRGGTARLFR